MGQEVLLTWWDIGLIRLAVNWVDMAMIFELCGCFGLGLALAVLTCRG
jgi:hypothetical protein